MAAVPHANPAFIGDDGKQGNTYESNRDLADHQVEAPPAKHEDQPADRATWGKGVEFLMSCIAMSVGLGNVWRFPFTALENGGGAFLIPYLIVLFLVGRPVYYLEMIIGQFSSRGSVKVYDLCPAMRGVGIGQVIAISSVTTYYLALLGMTLRYLFDSFKSPLPWANCRESWDAVCVPSDITLSSIEQRMERLANGTTSVFSYDDVKGNESKPASSAELYFVKEVLREKDNINDGIGSPNWELVLGLLVSWTCVFLIVRRGVKSSGKASYFLAIFPYVIMLVLLIRAVTLPGAKDGIIFFIKPDWGKILEPKVWYAAVTQCFFSLSVCFGNIIMYSSYNRFSHNVYRDAVIVTSLDTVTSLLSGFTIFGILGNLAHEIGTTNIKDVVKGDTGLAFISYPDAISKFRNVPQVFSVLFFLMLFVLGVGSVIAMTSCTITAVRDNFPRIKQWQCSLAIAVVSFFIGLAYVTPGGQFILTLVDYHGASMIALILGILELCVLAWIYGVNRLCKDVQFMLNRKVGLYWRLCWAIFTPLIMIVILIYFLADYKPLTYNKVVYPDWAYGLGWFITAFGVLQVPLWMGVAVYRQPGNTFKQKFFGAFRPTKDWGPSDPLLREQYNKELDSQIHKDLGFFGSIRNNIFG